MDLYMPPIDLRGPRKVSMVMTRRGERVAGGQRAMVRWERRNWPQGPTCSVKTIKRFGAVWPLTPGQKWSIQERLEWLGIEFLDADDYRSRRVGEGVRFHKDRQQSFVESLLRIFREVVGSYAQDGCRKRLRIYSSAQQGNRSKIVRRNSWTKLTKEQSRASERQG